jgi:signal transduction histidine kinase/ActR/RegA family two-component response regulator/HAMP domain-containing protein
MAPLRFLRRFYVAVGLVVLLMVVRAAVVFRSFSDEPLAGALFLGSSLVIILLLLGAAYYLSRDLRRRLGKVLNGMESLRKGEFPLLKVEAEDELGDLARGFNHMVEELRKRDERLEQWSSAQQQTAAQSDKPTVASPERERLGTVLEPGGEGVVVLDADQRIMMANFVVCQLLGVPPEALMGRDADALLAQLRSHLQDPAQAVAQMEQQRRRPEDAAEATVRLRQPAGQSIRFYFAPMRGAYAAMMGRIAGALDAGRHKDMERLKSEFLATISHELRTPLTSVKGSLGLVRGGAAGPISADLRELLEIAQANTDRLIQVINDLLDIAQLERGQVAMDIHPMRLSAAVADALQVMVGEASKKRIAIEAEVSDELPAVKGDLRRVTQVLMNLLSNAIKFSSPGTQVRVSAQPQDGNVLVAVRDFGRGMNREFLGRLFRKFEHAQGSLTRDSQGVGLGLAISRHIVQAHGGSIWAESEPEKGSTFFFTLPAVAQAPADASWNAPALTAGSQGPRLILVIDHDPDVARVLAYVYEAQGHRVLRADSGREGIELARRHRPDLVTVDLLLTEDDPYRVLRALRGQPETAKLPIICISAHPDAAAALAQGADFHLEKPLDIEKLRALTQRALARAREAEG